MIEAYIISLVTCILGSLIAYGMSGEKSYFSFVDGSELAIMFLLLLNTILAMFFIFRIIVLITTGK